MKFLRHPVVNMLFISLLSAFYSFLFIFTSGHMEFQALLPKTKTLQSGFWNRWLDFIKAGNMKYIGYAIILITLLILIFIFLKPVRKYDEYQVSILSRSIMVSGLLSILMLPVVIILILSDPSYLIAVIFLFAVIQWSGILITDLVYVVSC